MSYEVWILLTCSAIGSRVKSHASPSVSSRACSIPLNWWEYSLRKSWYASSSFFPANSGSMCMRCACVRGDQLRTEGNVIILGLIPQWILSTLWYLGIPLIVVSRVHVWVIIPLGLKNNTLQMVLGRKENIIPTCPHCLCCHNLRRVPESNASKVQPLSSAIPSRPVIWSYDRSCAGGLVPNQTDGVRAQFSGGAELHPKQL